MEGERLLWESISPTHITPIPLLVQAPLNLTITSLRFRKDLASLLEGSRWPPAAPFSACIPEAADGAPSMASPTRRHGRFRVGPGSEGCRVPAVKDRREAPEWAAAPRGRGGMRCGQAPARDLRQRRARSLARGRSLTE